jgi:hypothetical protein
LWDFQEEEEEVKGEGEGLMKYIVSMYKDGIRKCTESYCKIGRERRTGKRKQ